MITQKIEALGFAKLIGSFESGSPEWHAARVGVGGSDVGVIFGKSQYKSLYRLWAEKTGRVEDTSSTIQMRLGSALEPALREFFAAENKDWLKVHETGTWQSVQEPWQKANPDALYFDAAGELCLLEIKTSQYEDDYKGSTPGEYVIPNHYFTQVQWYLQALGLKRGTLAVLFHGNLYQEITFEANQFEQDVNLQDCAHFWELVQNDIKPEWDGADVTVEAVRKQHPDIDADESVELMELAQTYFIADQQVKEYQATLNAAKAEILDIMGNAKYGTQGGEVVFVRSARGQGVPYLTVKKGSK